MSTSFSISRLILEEKSVKNNLEKTPSFVDRIQITESLNFGTENNILPAPGKSLY